MSTHEQSVNSTVSADLPSLGQDGVAPNPVVVTEQSQPIKQARQNTEETFRWLVECHETLAAESGQENNISDEIKGEIEYSNGSKESWVSAYVGFIHKVPEPIGWNSQPQDPWEALAYWQGVLIGKAGGGLSLELSAEHRMTAVDILWRVDDALVNAVEHFPNFKSAVTSSLEVLVGFMRVCTQRGDVPLEVLQSTVGSRNALRLLGAVEFTRFGDNEGAAALIEEIEDSPNLQHFLGAQLEESQNTSYQLNGVSKERSKENLERYVTNIVKWPEIKNPDIERAELHVGVNTNWETIASMFGPASHGRYFSYNELPDYINADKNRPSGSNYSMFQAFGMREIVENEDGFRKNIFSPIPVYGALASNLESMGAAQGYGAYSIIWVKDEILDRPGTAFSLGDSTTSYGTVRYPDAIQAYRHTLDYRLATGFRDGGPYMEARLPMLSIKDVAKVTLDYGGTITLITQNLGVRGLAELIASNGVDVEILVHDDKELESARQRLEGVGRVTIKVVPNKPRTT